MFPILEAGGVHSARGASRGSFFSKSRLPLKKWLLLLFFWLREFPVTTAALDAEIHKSTAIDVYQWFREVCTTTLLNTQVEMELLWK